MSKRGVALRSAGEGVCQIELASEDMGAYGIDLGTDVAQLLLKLSDALLKHCPWVTWRDR